MGTENLAYMPTRTERKDTPFFTRFWRWEASGVLVALVALTLALALAADNFLSSYNMSVVARQAAFVGLVALGQTLLLLVGGIDLSVGATAGLSAIIGAYVLTNWGIHPYLIIPIAVGFGFLLGAINGFFVAMLRLNPSIVTLATWEIFAGITLVITKGYPLHPLGDQFGIFGKGEILGVPVPVLILMVLAAVLIWMLFQTRFGRNIFAVGGNRDAAILAGIRARWIEFLAFGMAGAFAALAVILFASRMDAGQPSVGEGWLMGAITAAILGGTSLRGGQGSIVGTVLGALLLAVLANGTVLMNVSGFWRRVIIGCVVLVDLLRRRD